jgi:hypothetical protein
MLPARRARGHCSAPGAGLPGIIDPDPLPLTPDEGSRFGGDLRSTPDWCERALADGRAAIHEHRRRVEGASSLRHTRLHASRREVFSLDELDCCVPSLRRHEHRSQEYPHAQRAHEAAGNFLSDVHRDSFDHAHRQALSGGSPSRCRWICCFPRPHTEHNSKPVCREVRRYIVAKGMRRNSPLGSRRVRLH